MDASSIASCPLAGKNLLEDWKDLCEDLGVRPVLVICRLPRRTLANGPKRPVKIVMACQTRMPAALCEG